MKWVAQSCPHISQEGGGGGGAYKVKDVPGKGRQGMSELVDTLSLRFCALLLFPGTQPIEKGGAHQFVFLT